MPAANPDVRIAYFGDSLTNGTGDDSCLGWVGRLSSNARRQGIRVTHYNLGIRHQTSVEILARFSEEAQLRLPATVDRRVVLSFGVNDTAVEGGVRRVELADSLATAGALITAARKIGPTLWIGPPPVMDPAWSTRIRELCHGYRTLAGELDVPYLPTFDALAADEDYRRSLTQCDDVHPADAGYAAWARLVERWPGWWFRADQPAGSR